HRGSARHREPQLAEEARVLEVRPLVARAGRPDVAEPPRDEEEVAALEHQLVGAGRLRQRGQVLVAEELQRGSGAEGPGRRQVTPPRRYLARPPPRPRTAPPAPLDRAAGSRRPSAPPTTGAAPVPGSARG